MKDCILYLVRSSTEDLDSLNKSLDLLEKNLLPSLDKSKTDILLFHESSFEEYKPKVKKIKGIQMIFLEIKFEIPKLNIPLEQIPEFFPHPTHGNGPIAYWHKGFTMGYRHMCRFFTGWLYEQEIMQNYEYYLRLDTDSFVLSFINFDLFVWMRNNNCEYSYIKDAIQIDNPKVVIGLWETTAKWLVENGFQTETSITEIQEGKMFYTNFELAKTSSFLKGSKYFDFYKFIDVSGGIFQNRWGDAPLKYLGVNLFIPANKLKPITGFTYQHGAVYTC
jgi:alpha 1,2-mannosyltransferase